MPKICAIPNCKTGTKGVDEKRSLFRVPMNEEHRKKWENAIPGSKQLKSTQSICERHFQPKEIHRRWIKYDNNGKILAQYDYPRPRLDARAVPSIFTDEEAPDPVDPWIIYRQKHGLQGSTVLSASNANKMTSTEANATEDSMKSTSTTIQQMYSTGEHSYCRMEVESMENVEADDDVSSNNRKDATDIPLDIPQCDISQPPEKVLNLPVSLLDTPAVEREPDQLPKLIKVEKFVEFLVKSDKPQQSVASQSEQSQASRPASVNPEPMTAPNGRLQQITLTNPHGKSERITVTSIKQEPEEIAEFEPLDEGVETKKSKLRVDTGGILENENSLVKLPYMWSVNEVITAKGKQIVFSHVIFVTENNVETPVLKKSVVIDDRSGKINYYAHGKLLDIGRTKLPRNVSDIVSMQITLYTFQKMRICGGITPINKNTTSKDIYQDYMQCWRHNNCTILVDRGKCEPCSRLQKTLSQKRRRAEKNPGSLRLSSAWDPSDQVVVLKKKLDLERRKRAHAQAQVKKLTEASKENGVRVTFVKNITL